VSETNEKRKEKGGSSPRAAASRATTGRVNVGKSWAEKPVTGLGRGTKGGRGKETEGGKGGEEMRPGWTGTNGGGSRGGTKRGAKRPTKNARPRKGTGVSETFPRHNHNLAGNRRKDNLPKRSLPPQANTSGLGHEKAWVCNQACPQKLINPPNVTK